MDSKMTSVEKTKFEELRALKVLQFLFPDKYEGAILSEAPDIINKGSDVGVEITSSMKQTVQKGNAIVRKLSGKKTTELTDRDYAKINAEGISVFPSPTGVILGIFTHWGNCHDLIVAYRNKTETLNKPHFSVFAENNLFIVAWLIDNDELNSGIRHLINSWDESNEQGYRYFFDYVYILTEGLLAEIDLEKATVNNHRIEKEQMNTISHSAFKDIFGVSRDEYYIKMLNNRID